MHTIAELERSKASVLLEIEQENKRHTQKLEDLKHELDYCQREINIILNNLDSGKILHAEHMLDIGGLYKNAGSERQAVVEKAIAALLKGGGILLQEYVGTKDYAHFHGQAVSCKYGYGPTHGSVIFKIGLTRAARMKDSFTEDEISDGVYYLRNLERIQSCQAQAPTD